MNEIKVKAPITIVADPKWVVSAVYSGKPGCACGCNGNHTSSDRSKKIIMGKIEKVMSGEVEGEVLFWPGSYISAETKTRLYIAYLDGRTA